ncbi:MAG TPA: metalloregulator ArsR/SmtB family transcription factor [Allosphingosinicella sp.]|uniref:ArsR/SmtB family transcription factor n=1 Tax=Allosphingosinicella sp. TaxID=2823234 RepID=UPI002ED8029B
MDRFVALADPTRRQIMELLGSGELTAGAIGARFPISAPAVSQHLKTLRESGLVRVRVDGQRRIYSLDPDGLAEMEEWFAKMRGFWSGRLDALEKELKKGEKK